jgi:NADPH:quinone reductase-like Zn-dependent oxidoreductase
VKRTVGFAFALGALVALNGSLHATGESLPKTMKAIVAHEYGGPEVLKLEDVPVPEPKENEILVRVIASGVNPADPLILGGKFAKEFGTRLPLILGYEMAGVVVKAGSKVIKLKVGDAVYAYPLWGGGWAEYCISNEGESATKPKSLSFTEASAVPLAALTAWQALIDIGKIDNRQTVLIHGGSGGVGSFAIQIAKARGARVISSASTANQDLLKQLGADVFVDYTTPNWEATVHDVDLALLPVGGETMRRTYGVMKKGGTIATLISRADPAELQKRGIRGAPVFSHPDASELAEITKLIDAGKIKPVVTQVFPLSDAAKADAQAATHHIRGKIVLKIADEPKI